MSDFLGVTLECPLQGGIRAAWTVKHSYYHFGVSNGERLEHVPLDHALRFFKSRLYQELIQCGT